MAFTTTIKWKYMAQKLSDLKRFGSFEEYKERTDFWEKRIPKLQPGDEAVFLCGQKVHRFIVNSWRPIHNREDIPPRYRSAIKTEQAYAIICVNPSVNIEHYESIERGE